MDSGRRDQLNTFMRENQLPKLSHRLLNVALTHKSFANELNHNLSPDLQSHNQRLEFLGDAILGAVIAAHIYQENPNYDEGKLTQRKSEIVCEATLSEIGSKLSIGEYLLMGKGELSSGGGQRVSNIADAVESLIGVIFLEKGYSSSQKFILSLWKPYFHEGSTPQGSIDYKSRLQELLLKTLKIRPEYEVMGIEGPEHENIYQVALFIDGKKVLQAKGMSKKKAEQKAAEMYLKENPLQSQKNQRQKRKKIPKN